MGTLSAAVTAVSFILFHNKISNILWALGCRVSGCYMPTICGDLPEKNASAPSPLKVVMPSAGQTATTSLDLAMRYMGYKSFHIEEKIIYAHRLMWDVEDNEEFRRAVAGCNIESLTLEPPVDSLPHALQTSPSAKFILTWRDFPSWFVSSQAVAEPRPLGGKHGRWSSIFYDVAKSWRLCPWGFFWDRLTGGMGSALYAEGRMLAAPEQTTLLTYIVMRLLGSFGNDVDNALWRGNYKIDASEEAYLGHQDEIRRTVPAGQLLVFDPKRHGWAELERFLGRPAPKDRPFPHPRSAASWTNDCMYDQRPDVGAQAFALFLVLHVLNFSIVHLWVKAVLYVLWTVGRVLWTVGRVFGYMFWRVGLLPTSRLEDSKGPEDLR